VRDEGPEAARPSGILGIDVLHRWSEHHDEEQARNQQPERAVHDELVQALALQRPGREHPRHEEEQRHAEQSPNEGRQVEHTQQSLSCRRCQEAWPVSPHGQRGLGLRADRRPRCRGRHARHVPAESTESGRIAPGFTLTNSAGASVSLSDYRGRNVVLFFNERAGCQSCLVQMAEIEKNAAAFKELNATVLPIVMNTREQILRDMELNGVRTPFQLDDGRVSKAYRTLGRGMHADLPGHSFVLIDTTGRQRWYGEYPSMWLPPQQLLLELRSRLRT
jgi:peroxiredoxin